MTSGIFEAIQGNREQSQKGLLCVGATETSCIEVASQKLQQAHMGCE